MAPKKPDSLVLRFGNPGVDTIEEHQSFLGPEVEKERYVWWGWWAQEWEVGAVARLKDLNESHDWKKPLQIGLVYRKATLYYEALCDRIEIDKEGRRTGSPEPDATPTYYGDRACQAWLRFRKIVPLDETTYQVRYGRMPASQSTIYFIRREPSGEIDIIPKPNWNVKPEPAPGDWVLHLSDLHFGEFHGFPTHSGRPGLEPSSETLAERLVRRIGELDVPIGVVIASGDLITKGRPEDYEQVEPFFDALTEGLGLKRSHVVIVPGNHDFRVIEEDDLPTLNFKHEAAFRHFYCSYYGIPSEQEIEYNRIQRFTLKNNVDLVVLALNSAKLRGETSKEYGYIGSYLYEPMLEYLVAELEAELLPSLIVATLHHHVVPVARAETNLSGSRPVSLTLDAGELCETLQRFGVKLILHGHQHRPFLSFVSRALDEEGWTAPSPQNGIYVVGNGSTGARSQELSDEYRINTFGLYNPLSNEIAIRMEQFGPGATPEKTMFSLTLPVGVEPKQPSV